jgi:hypothetical protein
LLTEQEGSMSTLAKLLIVPALVVAFSVGVALAASGVGGSSTPEAQVAPATSTDDTTTVGTTTTEFEHRDGDDAREPGEDVSGPCDEAEHAFDPRCTGVGDDRDDNGGPGDGDDDRGDRAADDDSGPGSDNSGPGNGDDDDDDEDRSGRGDGDDDEDDDSSGHGGGDDDR